MVSRLAIVLGGFVFSASVMASDQCNISQWKGIKKTYKFLFRADYGKPYAKRLRNLKALSKEVRDCLEETDLAFELGDGYYSLQKEEFYAIYYPYSDRLAGYIQVGYLTYTEANDPDEIGRYFVRYNSRGQRISFDIE